ncbi:MAG: molybdopterin-synthase adenylyltransferase MoeB [Chthonomonadales bacterium]|nr:molybdopterin-synthase adenylyltransferase MoeB [Chthonomonadales bacterium]
MAVRLLIPTALRQYAGGGDEFALEAGTVRQALQSVVSMYPDLGKHLLGPDGALRAFVNVYVGTEDVRHLQGLDTAVRDGDEVTVVPSIAGGVGVADHAARADTRLTPEEITRYSRHLIMPEVGMEGQRRLKGARVLCVGAGGLGSPLAMYLAAAGVGTIGIVDFDVVDATNLQRQILHGTEDIGRPKLRSATDTLMSINPNVRVEGYETQFTSSNALDILRDYDAVVDGTDNFPTRYLVNDACVLLGKPNVYGSIFRFEGQASVFWAERGPCYRCLYPEPPPPGLVPSCAEGGVLGILPGCIGMIQATETVKLLLGIGEPLIGRLLLFDALKMRWRELKLRKAADCPICGENPSIRELIDYQQFCGVPAVAAEAPEDRDAQMSVRELKERFDRGERPQVVDVREPYEWEMARIPHTRLIPLGQVAKRAAELDPEQEVILQCRSGVRSMDALNLLRERGFRKLRNLEGGILAWSREIDPSVPEY